MVRTSCARSLTPWRSTVWSETGFTVFYLFCNRKIQKYFDSERKSNPHSNIKKYFSSRARRQLGRPQPVMVCFSDIFPSGSEQSHLGPDLRNGEGSVRILFLKHSQRSVLGDLIMMMPNRHQQGKNGVKCPTVFQWSYRECYEVLSCLSEHCLACIWFGALSSV